MGFKFPYAIQGMFSCSYRYWDPNKDDDMWMYFPAFRRIRRMSTKQRQDSVGGGQIFTMDTAAVFGGKVVQYNWKYLGRKEMLTCRNGKLKPEWEEGKYTIGIDNYYQKVNTYLLEGRSKDPNHMYSKFIMYMDPWTWETTWTLLYDRKGKLLHFFNYQMGAGTAWVPEFIMTIVDVQRRYTSNSFIMEGVSNQGIKPEFLGIDSLKKVFPAGR